jgi:hypothetical protein
MMKKWKLITLILWLFFILFPVILGFIRSNGEVTFSGLIFNPIDGYSYFAKMQQGVGGEWSFHLPYSSQENENIYIFTLYIFMGHISRIFGLSVPLVYHFFRIVFSVLLFFSLQSLLKLFFEHENIFYKGAFISLLFGGGMGWIYFLSGDLPVDFWIAEAFIFLSAFSAPHFVLTFLILSILLIIMIKKEGGFDKIIWVFLLSIVLVSISPFSAIIIGFLMGIHILMNKKVVSNNFLPFIVFTVPAIGIAAYQFLFIRNDPVLSIWNAQNITLTPSIINIIFGFSPLLIGIVVLSVLFVKKKIRPSKPIILLIIWIAFSILMAYLPFSLQRRFLVGIYLPIAIVFWWSLNQLLNSTTIKKEKVLIGVIFGLLIPSNLIIFLGSTLAINNYDQIFYVKQNLISAIDWMDQNISPKSVILSTDEHGLIIPALGNYKVVYGHPFESINADETKLEVSKFWTEEITMEVSKDLFAKYRVDYVLCEYKISRDECPTPTNLLDVAFDSNNIALFQVEN